MHVFATVNCFDVLPIKQETFVSNLKVVQYFLVDVAGENECLIKADEMTSLEQFGDNHIDKATCRENGGCHRPDVSFCYKSIGITKIQSAAVLFY